MKHIGVVPTMLFSLSDVVAMVVAPSRAPSCTASAAVAPVSSSPSFGPIGLYSQNAIAIQDEVVDSKGGMCSTSQCELRSTFPNLRVTNVKLAL